LGKYIICNESVRRCYERGKNNLYIVTASELADNIFMSNKILYEIHKKNGKIALKIVKNKKRTVGK